MGIDMNDLEMAKAMAKLEGEDICPSNMRKHILVLDNSDGSMSMVDYNPITDLALNCTLRDKYEVEIAYWLKSVSTELESGESLTFNYGDSIPRAVIECILKSKGLYK